LELCGEIVKHKSFGRGQIVEFANNYATVLFDDSKEEKKFGYPSAFGAFLELENKSFFKQIEEDKNEITEKEAEDKRIKQELANLEITIKTKGSRARSAKSTTAKNSTSNCSNIAFKCNYCDDGQMLEIWTAGGGVAQNKDGKPISLKNVRANSLAVLTTKLPRTKEKDRFIFAVFLIDENYEGDSNENGHVVANPKYIMQLSSSEARELKFWDYYFNPNKPEQIILGSALHRYLTDVQSAQMLKKICEVKKDPIEGELSREFLEHYCKIKKLEIDNLPIEGALQRINK